MQHVWMLLLVLLMCGARPAAAGAASDDLTNAIVGADPRSSLESGAGAAYHSAYGQPEPAAGTDADMADWSSYYHLPSPVTRDPRFTFPEPPPSDDADALKREPAQDAGSAIPLGKPDARRGVYYEDDLMR